jgi:hypothetical protein
MKRFQLVLSVVCALALVGCSSGKKKLELGGSCSLNSDCAEGLLCKFGACHKACGKSVDCATGERCVQVEGIAVCQLVKEQACGTGCKTPLACMPADNTCRNTCSPAIDCLGGQVCTAGFCVEKADNVAGVDGSAGPADSGVAPDTATGALDVRSAALDVAALDAAASRSDSDRDSACTPGAVVIFSEGTFNPGDWSESSIQPTGGATAASVQISTDGNPDAYRRMTHVLPAPSHVLIAHTYLPRVYDPKTGGAIDHIDYSEDQIEFSPPWNGAAIGWGVCIVQDGRIFVTTSPSNVFTNLSWKRAKLIGLTAADFSSTDPSDGGSSHPDFSASGAPMAFGFFRSNTNDTTIIGGAETTTHGIDNWSFAIYPKCQ